MEELVESYREKAPRFLVFLHDIHASGEKDATLKEKTGHLFSIILDIPGVNVLGVKVVSNEPLVKSFIVDNSWCRGIEVTESIDESLSALLDLDVKKFPAEGKQVWKASVILGPGKKTS